MTELQTIPYNPELETSLLGAIILDSDVMLEFGKIIKPELFYEPKNRIVCTAIRTLFLSNENIDPLTVTKELQKTGKIKEVDALYIANLTNRIASSANAERYIKILQEYQMRRDTIESCTKAINQAYDDSCDPLEMIAELGTLFDTKLDSFCDRKALSAFELVHDTVDNIKYRYNNRQIGVPTGFTDLNKHLGGFVKNRLYIIGARPAMGKTGFALNLAVNAARVGKKVAFFSLEMENEQLMQRIIAQQVGISSARIDALNLSEYELHCISEARQNIENLSIYFDDSPYASLSHIRAKSRQIKQREGLDLIFVDYLQLMKPELQKKNATTNDIIAEISKGLKHLSKELQVAVVALSQLSRKVEDRKDKSPMLSDLRDSGSIEQDADVVMFLHRPEYYDEKSLVDTRLFGKISCKGIAIVNVAKNRHGRTGDIDRILTAR